jgi:hypothetical protein
MDRRERNKQAVDVLTIEDDMDKFIQKDAIGDAELNRKIAVIRKHVRQRNEAAMTKAELFLDNWAFHHGGITKENMREALSSLARYAASIAKRAKTNREAQEEALDPDGMQDFIF